MKSITDPKALWDAQISLWQAALFVADGFVGLLLQSDVAIDQLRVSQSQQKAEEIKALNAQIESLKNNKPLIFTERTPAGNYQIRNVGGGLAINVWMLAENGEFISLGAMGEGESRPLPSPPKRQLFVAEARPSTGRRFTPCMNAITPTGDVVHGFLKPENDASLTIDTALSDYLEGEANLIQRFLNWHPGQAEARPRT